MDLDKVKYWSELSDYDLDTADAMTEEKCKELITKTREVQQWVKTMF